MNYCSDCGKRMPNSTAVRCPECLRRRRGANEKLPIDAPIGLSKRDFQKDYSKGAKDCVTAAGIGYVSAFVAAVVAFIPQWGGSRSLLIDALVVLILSLLIHVTKSRVAAIIFLVFSVYNCIGIMIAQGFIGGYLPLVGGVFAVIGSFRYAKEWREYLAMYY